MKGWLIGIGAYIWLLIVQHWLGWTAAAVTAFSMLAVALLALWEAGQQDDA